ncbi:hypothetical protein CXK86_20435 [Paenibacillus sp. BGI2013]|uniref:toxin-antitoxin system YwqK family antitoxin n=1 Tax=Paenibacillus sp. BGI2013 TaxID=2058902 RepID=UPI000C6D41F5|nr:hypothetical protein [Paenibacillus sp. BGI2013]PKQ89417.1 hypothetical protein CXK86_20435 [Paenibacillus sp. BGI2013]
MEEINILSKEEVLLNGLEFTGDVCFDGEYGDQVFDRSIEVGGNPITGLVYEKYSNGNLALYCYCLDGVPDGDYVTYYEDGKIEGFKRMHKGKIAGKSISWFMNGEIRSTSESLYGFKITYKNGMKQGN